MQATRRRGRVAATSSPLVSIAAQIVGKFRARLSYVSTFIATSVAQLRFEVKGGPPHANVRIFDFPERGHSCPLGG